MFRFLSVGIGKYITLMAKDGPLTIAQEGQVRDHLDVWVWPTPDMPEPAFAGGFVEFRWHQDERHRYGFEDEQVAEWFREAFPGADVRLI